MTSRCFEAIRTCYNDNAFTENYHNGKCSCANACKLFNNMKNITIEATHDITLGVPYWFGFYDDDLHKYKPKELIFTKRNIETEYLYGSCHTMIGYITNENLRISDKTDILFASEEECKTWCDEANSI